MTRTPLVTELDCVDVREALFSGRPLSATEAEHAAGCPVCSQALPAGDLLEPTADLLASVEAAVGNERGLAAWLRSLPTTARTFVGLGVGAALVAAMTFGWPRWAYGVVPITRVTLAVSVLAVLYALVLREALRPLQDAPTNRSFLTAILATGLCLPVVLALLPAGEPGDSAFVAIRTAAQCFWFGAVPGTLLVVALRALDRGAHAAFDVALLAAVGGGLVGNAALELHCASTAPLHLLLGHATVGIALVLVYAFGVRGGRARSDDG